MIPLAPGSLLAQSAPADTNNATLFTATLRTECTSLVIANVTTTTCKARIFLDEGGTTYAVGNALAYDVPIPPETVLSFDAENYGGWNLAPTDSIGIRTDTASGLTFSLFGVVAQAR